MTERNRTPYSSVLETIGWTPLIRLNRVTRGMRTPVFAKAEFFNPGGSVKDRIGMPIIERAEKEGIPVIENSSLDDSLVAIMNLVLETIEAELE